jgi:hypothetical protein
VSHTFSPEADRRAEALALCATLLAALVAVVVFFPAEGVVLTPLHSATDNLFGSSAFVLPLGLALVSGLAFARRTRPNVRLPTKRLVGLGLITIGLLPAEDLLGRSTGMVGEWFTGFLLALLGGPVAVALTLGLLMAGSVLAFDLKHGRRRVAAR